MEILTKQANMTEAYITESYVEKEEEIEDKNLENSTDKILQASLFESNEKEISTEEKKHSSNRSNKNLIRALLFFDDGSFEEYSNSDWNN